MSHEVVAYGGTTTASTVQPCARNSFQFRQPANTGRAGDRTVRTDIAPRAATVSSLIIITIAPKHTDLDPKGSLASARPNNRSSVFPCVQRGTGLRKGLRMWHCSIELIHRRAKGSAVYSIPIQVSYITLAMAASDQSYCTGRNAEDPWTGNAACGQIWGGL